MNTNNEDKATHVLVPIEWSQDKANDIKYLISYYQYRADYWATIPKGGKIRKHFLNSIEKLKSQ